MHIFPSAIHLATLSQSEIIDTVVVANVKAEKILNLS